MSDVCISKNHGRDTESFSDLMYSLENTFLVFFFFEVRWLILALNLSSVQLHGVPLLGSVPLQSRRSTSVQ